MAEENFRALTPSSGSIRDSLRALRASYNLAPSSRVDISESATPSEPPTAIPDRPTRDSPFSGVAPLSQPVLSNASPSPFVRPEEVEGDNDMVLESSSGTLPDFGPHEYAVPIPVEGIAKDEYLRMVTRARKHFEKFLEIHDESSPDLVHESERAVAVVRDLNKLLSHGDLMIGGTATQHAVSPFEAADWAQYLSQKFYFLQEFFKLSQELSKRVCIIAEDGRIQDILETFLKGRNIIYTRPGKPRFQPSPMIGELNVDILTMSALDTQVNSRPDMIICMDSCADLKGVSLRRLRGDLPGNGTRLIAPIVHLLSPFTAEHIERCLPRDLSGLGRQKALIKAVIDFSEIIRRMKNNDDSDEGFPIQQYAVMLHHFLQEPYNGWPENMEMPPLPLDFDSNEESPTNGHKEPPLASRIDDVPRALTPSGQKRSLSRDYETPSDANMAKRQRIVQSEGVAYPTDSVQGSHLENLTETKMQHAKQLREVQISLSNSDKRVQEDVKHISQLQETLINTETRLQEYTSSLEKLQYRFESRTNELHKIRQERDDHASALAIAEKRRDNTIKENTKLKEERGQLQQDLESARNDLKTGGGSMADVELLREENRRLMTAVTKLEKAAEIHKTDIEFVRSEYQKSSILASEHAGNVMFLEKDNQDLRTRIEVLTQQVKNMQQNESVRQHLSRIEELEMTLATRDELLRRKEDELRQLRQGRGMGTRASSVQPRSPRLGNSRPASPVPGNFVQVPMTNHQRTSALRYGEIR